ncbi:MAG TPA: hypothetical protein VGO65_07335 [Pseudolysinimonas sp.]|jgi:hypothetical protein|nr:hypothetical protein [Pseudolysinimonas sp.]
MAGKRDADVDPRFDPVFQRGYDPAKHRTRPRAVKPAEARREGPRAEAAAVEAVAVDPTPAETGTDTSPTAETEYELPRRNPFRLVLLLASVAALCGATAILWNRLTSDPYYYGSPNTDVAALFADNFIQAALPALTTGGMIGLALWLALGALRRHDHD